MRSLPGFVVGLEETFFLGSCGVGSFDVSQCLLGAFIALQEIGNLGTKGTMHCAHPWQHRIW